jgi:flagellar basal body P-ring formation protein FlgA
MSGFRQVLASVADFGRWHVPCCSAVDPNRRTIMRFHVPAALGAILAAVAPAVAPAAPLALEDLDFLDARIAVFLGGTAADAGKKAQPLDRRLRLLRCAGGALFDPPALGAIAAYCPSRGWRIRVPLTGAVETETAEIVIRRGDTVELAYRGAGFAVSTGATALEDARADGIVRVKSLTGTTPVTARVRGPGMVAIGD